MPPCAQREDTMTSIRHAFTPIALALAGMAVLPTAALADGPQAIAPAPKHEGLAPATGGIDMVHTHLHHVLNCLVGPGGDGFDAGPGNPCANAGGGAIPQTADAAMKAKLTAAATQARGGIATADMAAAKK